MSGHSKWANIKYRKESQDRKRSNLFSKLIKEITLQARNGEPNPELNQGLAQALERARVANLPKDNMERAIKRASGGADGVAYEEIAYEGYAPAGVAVLVRAVTDNRNRAAAAIRHVFSKHGGNMASAGSVAWLFERRGLVTIDQVPEGADHDEFLMSLIEFGAQEINEEGGPIEIYCAPSDFGSLSEKIRGAGVTPTRAELTMVPKNTVRVEGHSAEKVLKLINELDDNEDVQEVFANFDIPDEVLAKIGGES
jgi:YebC/PmpR family DNA-binding regulatory protein